MEIEPILKCKLFENLSLEDIQMVLSCLSAKKRIYEKGELIFRSGDKIDSMGLVISGRIHIIKDDFWGNRQIINAAKIGELFGESYAIMENESLLIQVEAAEKTEILFLNSNRIFTMCSSACVFHTKLIHNILFILAEKNLMLTQKIDHVGQKKTRDKILSYLSFESKRQNLQSFEIPFNRQQLADYLSVDRSALSAELSVMKKKKLLSYHKNSFTLFQSVDRVKTFEVSSLKSHK